MSFYRCTLLFICSFFVVSAGFAQQAVLSVVPDTADKSLSAASESRQASGSKASFRAKLTMEDDQVLVGQEFLVELPDKTAIAKRIELDGNNDVVLSFQDKKGSMVVRQNHVGAKEVLVYDMEAAAIYRGEVGSDGELQFTLEDNNKHYCVNYATDVFVPAGSESLLSKSLTENPMTEAEVKLLESRPGATNVIYIDYFGGTVTGTFWNAVYTGGAPIVYPPYSYDNNYASVSAADINAMYVGWAEMAEDFAPFDVNITTNEAVFNATAVANRSKVNATPDSTFIGGGGGVAVVGGFGSSYTNVAWTFNRLLSTMGQTHSHEAGHLMGLGHDGDSNTGEDYYEGHFNWGPIMGAPFGRDFVQWNNGTYPGNTTTQNDLTIINGVLGLEADDVGDNNAGAMLLDVSNDQYVGIIRPEGLGADTDVFQFNQGGSSTVSVTVRPSVQPIDNGTGVNLSFRATLRDSSNNVVDQVVPVFPFNANTNVLNFSGALNADSYYLTIENESPNTNLSTGFNEYGNGGYYTVDVSGGVVSVDPELVVGNLNIAPLTLDPGAAITTADATVTNLGQNASVATTLTFYIDDNAGFTTPTALSTAQAVGALSSNQSQAITASPMLVAPGVMDTYYVRACVAAVVNEADVNNNCSAAVTMTVSSEVDLTVPEITVTPGSIELGENFMLTAEVSNLDRSQSAATTLTYYIADNAAFTGETAIGVGESVSPVAGFGSVSVPQQTVTDSGTKGTFYVRACVPDDPNETNSANNCSSHKTLSVGADEMCFPITAVNGNVATICL